jgi:hypothetical protein
MIKETDTHIAGKLALWLGSVFSLVSLILCVLRFVVPDVTLIANDVSLAFLVSLFTLFVGYVYGRIEHLCETQQRILAQPVQGIEVFDSASELLSRLAEVTVSSRVVCTLNLSPPRGNSQSLDKYFRLVHQYLSSPDAVVTSFRSLAHVPSETKAQWIISRAKELSATGRFSQAVFDTEPTNVFTIGFHAVEKDGQFYVFFYPGVSLTGVMKCFLVKNKAVYDIMVDYFDSLWERSIIIHEGSTFRKAGLQKLKTLAPRISNDENLQELVDLSQ